MLDKSITRRRLLKASLGGAVAITLGPLISACSSSSPTQSSGGQSSSSSPTQAAGPGTSPSLAQVSASQEDILIGYVSPETGPLAPFGEPDQFIVDRVVKAINEKGIIINGSKRNVRVKIADSQSDPTHAGEVTKNLILQDKVDLIVAAHTPDTTNPVAAVAEANKIPCITTVAPIDPWLAGGPYKYSYHFFWDLATIIKVYTGIWEKVPTNKVVGGLWPNDPDGAAWAPAFTSALQKAGYTVVDVGRYPNGTQDFTAFIQRWKAANVEILTGVPVPPDFAALWRQCSQQGFRPKVASIGKAILFPMAVEAIGGDLANGLTSELWWGPSHPFKSSLSGETARQLCDAYPRQWTQPIGFAYALFEIAADAFRRAGTTDKSKVTDALAATQLDTIVGPIKFDSKHVSQTPLVGSQWVKGQKYPWELKIVYNDTAPNIPKDADVRAIGG